MNVPRTLIRTFLRAALRPFAPRLIPDERAPSYVRYTLLDLGEGRGRVYLHQWLRGDPDLRLHNHPWNALSILLAGWYREERLDPATGKVVSRTYRRGDLNAIRPETFHRIELDGGGAWSLVIAGQRTDAWGFLDRATGEFSVQEVWPKRRAAA